MRQIAGLVDVVSSMDDAKTVLSIRLQKERASDMGVNEASIVRTMSAFVMGFEVSRWTDPDGKVADVVLRLPEAKRSGLTALLGLEMTVASADGASKSRLVRLDQVADIVSQIAPSEIRHLGVTREILLSVDTSEGAPDDTMEKLDSLIAKQNLPPGYRIRAGGEDEALGKVVVNIVKALIMAVVFIYVVLTSQFGSFLQPLAIMCALPLSLVGVLFGLLVSGSTINMFSMIGFVMLMGLVTKNGILLVDFANRERRRGLSFSDALVKAGTVRFRPIIMTILAMIFGMVPLAIASSGGGAQRDPMAHAIIGGLISSTLLTLVVVPVALLHLDRLARRFSQNVETGRA
ncbi:hypothetical protein M673_04180 [Aureimonas sp. AU20]|nr:hypothetical protein M673_04180 [Aureimonas sp. AU20]